MRRLRNPPTHGMRISQLRLVMKPRLIQIVEQQTKTINVEKYEELVIQLEATAKLLKQGLVDVEEPSGTDKEDSNTKSDKEKPNKEKKPINWVTTKGHTPTKKGMFFCKIHGIAGHTIQECLLNLQQKDGNKHARTSGNSWSKCHQGT